MHEDKNFDESTSEDTSEGTSEGTSDSVSLSESDSESSESSEMNPAYGIRKNMHQKGKKEHQGMRKHGKRGGKRFEKHNRAEKNMESTSNSETSSDSESSIEEMFLPALPETVKPLDLAYIPQASIDKRHGGRHLNKKGGKKGKHGKKGGKNGKRGKKGCHGKGGKGGKGKHGNELGGKDHHGKGHHGKGHHGGKHHHMAWCMAIGAFLYSALIMSFLCIYKKFISAFRDVQNIVALQKQTVNMSVEDRNKAYLDMTTGTRCQRKVVRKQVNAPQRQHQYLPPNVVAPNLDNDALTQSLIAPRQH